MTDVPASPVTSNADADVDGHHHSRAHRRTRNAVIGMLILGTVGTVALVGIVVTVVGSVRVAAHDAGSNSNYGFGWERPTTSPTSIEVLILGGGAATITVVETPESIRLIPFGPRRVPCACSNRQLVNLSAPVGSRLILDGRTGEQIRAWTG